MSISSFVNEVWLKQLPHVAFHSASCVELYPFSPSDIWLTSASGQEQHQALTTWFLHRYASPEQCLPFDHRRGRYVHANSRLFDAEFELSSRFHTIVPERVIMAVVRSLEASGQKQWMLSTDTAFSLSPVQTPPENALQSLVKRLSEVHSVRINAEPLSGAHYEMLYFETIRLFELFCVELCLARVVLSKGALAKLVSVVLPPDDRQSFLSASLREEELLSFLRNQLMRVSWFHWPTFVHLFHEGLNQSVSAFAELFAQVYTHYQARHMSIQSSWNTGQAPLHALDVDYLYLSVLKLAEALHQNK